MSRFLPTKRNLRKALHFFFYLKKTAEEYHVSLLEAYGEFTPTDRTVESWFRPYKRGDFDVQDKEPPG